MKVEHVTMDSHMPYTLTMRDACVAFHGEQEIFQ